jgi:predicted ArsR family transcriptional regulator
MLTKLTPLQWKYYKAVKNYNSKEAQKLEKKLQANLEDAKDALSKPRNQDIADSLGVSKEAPRLILKALIKKNVIRKKHYEFTDFVPKKRERTVYEIVKPN